MFAILLLTPHSCLPAQARHKALMESHGASIVKVSRVLEGIASCRMRRIATHPSSPLVTRVVQMKRRMLEIFECNASKAQEYKEVGRAACVLSVAAALSSPRSAARHLILSFLLASCTPYAQNGWMRFTLRFATAWNSSRA